MQVQLPDLKALKIHREELFQGPVFGTETGQLLHNLFQQGPLLVTLLLLEVGLALVDHHVPVLWTYHLLVIIFAAYVLSAHLAVNRAGLPDSCLGAVPYLDPEVHSAVHLRGHVPAVLRRHWLTRVFNCPTPLLVSHGVGHSNFVVVEVGLPLVAGQIVLLTGGSLLLPERLVFEGQRQVMDEREEGRTVRISTIISRVCSQLWVACRCITVF